MHTKTYVLDPAEEYATGITRLGDIFYQLTNDNGILNALALDTDEDGNAILTLTTQYAIPRDNECNVPEGWGLTDDETYLYMSDRSNHIYRIDPGTLQEFDEDEFSIAYDADQCPEDSHFSHIYSVFNSETGEEFQNIGELELVNNNMYANIYDESLSSFLIIKIYTDPESEAMTVQRTYDFCLLHELLCEELLRAEVSTT